jgi:putative IMPACT (imprinted ancient) family translation regulator
MQDRLISEKRFAINNKVANFCFKNNLDYRSVWRVIYNNYEDKYKIPVSTWYKMGHKSKLDFLVAYENLYSTLTKLELLINELN